ncbi:MAG: hypothetical protein AAF411_13175 [Myxococcota bacterium]
MAADHATRRLRRERFLPFAFAPKGLRLSLESASVDGEVIALEGGGVRIEDPRWRTLRLTGSVSVDEQGLNTLTGSERDAPFDAATCWVVVRCAQTYWRRGYALSAPDHRFELCFQREDVAGMIELVPWLVRSTVGMGAPGFASAVGARLAGGARLRVVLHEPAERPGSFLDVRYVRFSEDPALRLEPWRLYHLDTLGDAPLLRINRDHESIAEVLDARGQTGMNARLREVFYDQIARGVWAMLFMHSVEGLDDEGFALHRWQNGVIEELLPDLFPAVQKRKRRRALAAARQDPSHISRLASRCDAALQRRLEIVKHMSRLLQEADVRRA